MSHSSWVRGLKLLLRGRCNRWACRTPRECVDWNNQITQELYDWLGSHSSWVRGLKKEYNHTIYFDKGRTPRECVDWNKDDSEGWFRKGKSHSSWVRGLKHRTTVIQQDKQMSHSSWVRGLKLPVWYHACCISCRTPRECVDWNIYVEILPYHSIVALLVSAWIETYMDYTSVYVSGTSHSSWVRGLKRNVNAYQRYLELVALLVSAWIETDSVEPSGV